MYNMIKIITQNDMIISILNQENIFEDILIAILEKTINSEKLFMLELLYNGEKYLIAYDQNKKLIDYLYNNLYNTFYFDIGVSNQINTFDYNLWIELYNKQEKEKNV